MSILVIAEHDNKSLKGATLNTVAAATKISDEISLLIAGSDMDSVIDEAQKIDSVNSILKCDNDIYKNALAED